MTMAQVEHVCLACADIEKEKAFYATYFDFVANGKYHNLESGWENYFLSPKGGGVRIELLHHKGIAARAKKELSSGLAHFALSLGSVKAVDAKATQLKKAGYLILSGPRKTGDGYYEAAFLDPEGNKVEITI